MTLQIQMIGTGSAFAKKYFNNNALVRTSNFTLLIDCGITAPLSLHQLDVPFNEIDALLISHLHADHVGGLEEFAFQMKYKYKAMPSLYIADKLIGPLWEQCLKAGMDDTGHMSLEDYFRVIPMKDGEVCRITDDLSVEPLLTKHVPGKASYSFILNESIFYSADCTFNPSLLEQLYNERGIRIFMHDCQLEGPPTLHATLDQLLTLPEHIQQHTILMHYGDNKDEYIGKTGAMRFIEQYETVHLLSQAQK